MKVIARHQIYLDYVLPRSTDWPVKPIRLTYFDVDAFVQPRPFDEELFPNEVDKDLFHLRVPFSKAQPYVSGEGYFSVREKCLDRLQVDIHIDVESLDEVKTNDKQEHALVAAVDAANVFLSHCRVAARDAYVRGVERHYSLQDDEYFTLNPRTTCWYEADTGERIPAYERDNSCIAHSGSRPLAVTKPVSMENVIKSIEASEEPLLPLSLLTDATWQLRTMNLRESLLIQGSACEVAGNFYIRGLAHGDSLHPDDVAPGHATFAERVFHYIPIHFESRSLQDERPGDFDLVQKMYWTRNNVAHEGRAYFTDPEDGSEVVVDQRLATTFLTSSQDAIDWLLRIGKFSKNGDA